MNMDYWYRLFKIVTGIFQSIFISEVILLGKENLPLGPKVYAGNHPNTANAMILPNLFPDRLHFLAYADTFKLPFFGWLLTLADQIRVAPGLGRTAINQAIDRLRLGNSLVILPEGRMTLRGQGKLPGTSAVRLSLKTGAPVIPFSFYVPKEYIHSLKFRWFGKIKASRWQLRGACYVVIGRPWYPSQFLRSRPTSKQIRQLTYQLMNQIDSLTQEAITYTQS